MEKFNSDQAPEPDYILMHAKLVIYFLSGIGPREKGTKVIPRVELDENGQILAYDIAAQCHSVFKNVRLILEASVAAGIN